MKTLIKFSKMHALGNDIVIVYNLIRNKNHLQKVIPKLSNRYTGIGFDQIIFFKKNLNTNINTNTDFKCQIFNSDGSEASQCGNGMRCLFLYIKMNKLSEKNTVRIKNNLKITKVKYSDNKLITVNMGKPDFHMKITKFNKKSGNYYIVYKMKKIKLTHICIGNIHYIAKVKSINALNILHIVSLIKRNTNIHNESNISFMQILDDKYIKIITYERGVGITKSCGSAACAAVAVGIKNKILTRKVIVNSEYGNSTVTWNSYDDPIYLTGPAEHIYDGVLKLNI